MSSLLLVPLVVVLVIAAVVAVVAGVLQAVVHVAAARAPRGGCQFDDAEAEPSRLTRLLIALREWLGSCAVLAGAPFAIAPVRTDATARPLVLVHGWPSAPASLRRLARRLRRDGWPTVHVPRLGIGWRDLADGATRLEQALARIRGEAVEVDVVAHGLAGLAARLLLHRRGRAAGIRRLLTLGTPHQGTTACAWMPGGPLRDARPGSALLRGMGDGTPDGVDVITLSSPDDALQLPADAAYWPGAFNITVRGVGHLGLVRSARVYELVRENLAAEPPAPERRHAG